MSISQRQPATIKPNRRRFQYSLAGLLVGYLCGRLSCRIIEWSLNAKPWRQWWRWAGHPVGSELCLKTCPMNLKSAGAAVVVIAYLCSGAFAGDRRDVSEVDLQGNRRTAKERRAVDEPPGRPWSNDWRNWRSDQRPGNFDHPLARHDRAATFPTGEGQQRQHNRDLPLARQAGTVAFSVKLAAFSKGGASRMANRIDNENEALGQPPDGRRARHHLGQRKAGWCLGCQWRPVTAGL